MLGIAVVMLMWHNAWMARHGREIADEMRRVGTAVSEGAKPLTALAVVVGLAVLREGSEVVLFLYGIIRLRHVRRRRCLLGGVLGIAAGAAFTALTYFGLLAIPTAHIFSVTSWLIALARRRHGGAVGAVPQQCRLLLALDSTVWDTSWLLSEGSIFGRMLHALIGYTERPTRDAARRLYRHAVRDVPADAVRALLTAPTSARRRRITLSASQRRVSAAAPVRQRQRRAPDRSI